jgi:GT2 family glycosyltransferase
MMDHSPAHVEETPLPAFWSRLAFRRGRPVGLAWWRAYVRLLRLRRTGSALPLVPQPGNDSYGAWVEACDTLQTTDRALIGDHIEAMSSRQLVSVIMPLSDAPIDALCDSIESVRAQLYPHWELCIIADAAPSRSMRGVLSIYAAMDPRIRWTRRPRNSQIAPAMNDAIARASGEFVALMGDGDMLAERALYEVVAALDAAPQTDLLYSDEDRIDRFGRRQLPFFKPGWDPDLILGQNYFNHLGVYRRSLLEKLGGPRPGYEGSEDYDLVLRALAHTTPERIRHIPAMLYHWRLKDDRPVSASQIARHIDTARRAIEDHLPSRPGGRGAKVEPCPLAPEWHRVRWPLPDKPPLVTVVIPTRDKAALLARAVEGILNHTAYPNIDVIIADNESTEPASRALLSSLSLDPRVRVVGLPGPFNYAAINNEAVRYARGDILLFMNNDITVIEPFWLHELVAHALRPDVGAVGASLLFPDGAVQHAGVILGVPSLPGRPGVAGHFGTKHKQGDKGYVGQLALARTVSASTAACLAMRKAVFDAAGGFDEVNLAVSYNDVDLCLRLREQGLRTIWTPFAELVHHESASRGSDLAPENTDRAAREWDYMHTRWGYRLRNDVYYNENFSRDDADNRLAIPGCRMPPWRGRRNAAVR